MKASEYVNKGYIFLSTPNIKGRDIDFKNVNYINEERYLESPEIMLQKGDVILAKDGSTLGISNVVRELPANATVNSSLAVIRPKPEIDPEFLNYFINGAFTQNIIKKMKDGMGVPHLFQADIRKFIILVPPINEQKAIAEYLNKKTLEISCAIEKIDLIINSLIQFRVSLITETVTGKINVTE